MSKGRIFYFCKNASRVGSSLDLKAVELSREQRIQNGEAWQHRLVSIQLIKLTMSEAILPDPAIFSPSDDYQLKSKLQCKSKKNSNAANSVKEVMLPAKKTIF